MYDHYDEEKVMGAQIQKVKNAINKILAECTTTLPEVQFGWSGMSIDVYLSGGNYQIRNMIESHFANSRKYKGVESQNNDTKKRISFYLV